MTQNLPRNQRGAALFVALIMLLVITLLALSGARESTLEGRITGNLVEQQKLTNNGEGGLRQGERALTAPPKPHEQACNDLYCFLSQEAVYGTDFDSALDYVPVSGDSTQSVKWYAVTAPSGSTEGQAENPEYGNMMLGIGTFRYEINVESTNSVTGHSARLRSTTAKVFN
ncbi:pilus assembly protein PilX [Ectopseudomonas khazarica]|uniref:pilus assembly PilX family protein n=1 Tax=Ectopseudomonas khazarica TaxID=2502979 RepID=UPI001AEF72C3|nr:PilX N-terminal domain-containing pilus assembly protein [Pseudomonas khazarica]QTS87544.1 pilus assembly protein PilX [Pseudomonas khazarica]